MTFSDRLKRLIGERTVSEFARSVGLGESLIRKYLKGSEPTLSRAHQIAEATQCTLEWLASGKGYPYREGEIVDQQALHLARRLVEEETGGDLAPPDNLTLVRVVAVYLYLRQSRLRDGDFDEPLARSFARFLKDEHNVLAYVAKSNR